ncbi:sporulation protein [Vulcanibacillus modesticaldus]|uniref:Sporulation protein n=1 Tax=Vulcanibacillus modesticaldus TaxID=337097 RepID=A0A1D2YWN3_9BACI|nr:YtrH family sporulation protein [Vulcanibacillus modesticaldus]OEG00072.1 sporulation protein [Vulcanibacillus modesticaldus]
MEFIKNVIMYYFIAFGVLLGGSLFGGLGAFLTNQPPIFTMLDYADRLKIWALVVALGGTFDAIKVFEISIIDGNISSLIKQIIYILMALVGALTAEIVLHWLFKGDIN